MTISEKKIYPRTGDNQTVYLKNIITNPNIIVGDYTMYNDFVHDPVMFEKNNVLYHYPINHDRLVIGKFCSIACGARFLFNSANHKMKSLSTYPFPLFFEEWNLDKRNVVDSWDNKGDIVIGNDDVAASLLQMKWWDWPEERIRQNLSAIQTGQIDALK